MRTPATTGEGMFPLFVWLSPQDGQTAAGCGDSLSSVTHGRFQELLHLAVASSACQGSASCHRTGQFANKQVFPLSSAVWIIWVREASRFLLFPQPWHLSTREKSLEWINGNVCLHSPSSLVGSRRFWAPYQNWYRKGLTRALLCNWSCCCQPVLDQVHLPHFTPLGQATGKKGKERLSNQVTIYLWWNPVLPLWFFP